MYPVAFCEIDSFPSAVLAEHYPSVRNLGDITKVDWSAYSGAVDVVVGGSPCQSFSVAGTRTGLEGASGLMWEYVRAVREIMPRYAVWENVPGALSSTHGEDFRCLLEALDACGYGLAWRVLDAQFFGVAQRRERVFLVGCLGNGGAERACEVLFEPESLRWDTPSSREERQALASGAGRGATSAGFKFSAGKSAGGIGFAEGLAPTLTADYHNPAVLSRDQIFCMADATSNAAVDKDICGTVTAHCCNEASIAAFATDSDEAVVRRLTPRECERLQGFPDDWTKVPYKGKPAEECPDTPRYRAVGNSMAVPVMRWIGRRLMDAEVTLHHVGDGRGRR